MEVLRAALFHLYFIKQIRVVLSKFSQAAAFYFKITD